jgi:hypothetical protein
VPAVGATASLFPAAADRSGTPVAQATVDDNGVFTILDVETPADYELVVDKGESGTYRQAVAPVALQPGQDVVLDQLLLVPGDGTVAGTVLQVGGQPLGGAAVELTTSGGGVAFRTRTPTEGDGLGTFRLSGLPTPETYTLQVSAPGFVPTAVVITLGIAQTLDGQNLTVLPAVGSITGTVSTPDPAGDGSAVVPLGGVRVAASGPPSGSTGGSAQIVTVTLTADEPTAATGSFRLDGLAVPGTYVLTYELAGFATVVSDPISLTPDAPTAVQAVTLAPTTGGINGVVVDRLGDGLVDVPVRVSGATVPAQGATVRTVSAPAGQFVVAGLAGGPYIVEIAGGASGFVGQRQTVDVVAGAVAALGTIVVESVDQVVVSDQTEAAVRLVVRGVDGTVLEDQPYVNLQAVLSGLPHGSLVTFEAFAEGDALLSRAAVVLDEAIDFPFFEGSVE